MRALQLHLRSCGLMWSLLPLTVLGLSILLLRPRYWVGIWPETGAAGQIPAFFLSTIGAGAAAWVSGSRTRHNLDEQVAAAAIPRAKSEAFRLSTVMIIFLAPYLIGQAVAFAFTARTFPVGLHLWLAYAAMGVIVILLATTWGWAVGKYLGPAYASLVAVLTWLVFEGFPGEKAALGVVSGPVWQEPSASALTVRLGAMAVFVAAVVWAPPRRTQWSASRLGALLPMAAGAMAAVAVLGTTGMADRDAPVDPLCVDGKIDICLWPEHAKYVPLIQSLDARVATLPTDFRTPERLNEYGIERMQYNYRGKTFTQLEGIDISEGNKWSLALGLSDAIVTETLRSCDLDGIREDPAPEALRRWVEFYIADSSIPDYQTSGVPENIENSWAVAEKIFTEFTPEEQGMWVQRQVAQVRASHCAK